MRIFTILIALLSIARVGYGQTLYPYLQTPSPTSMYINWKTDNNMQSTVQYGIDSFNLSTTVNGWTNVYSDVGYPNNYFYHTVKLTGLTPNTKYYYKVQTGAEVSAIYSFKTLPQPGQAADNGHIRFLILGDNQLYQPRFDSLVSAAKRQIYQNYGGQPSDNIAMTFMVGDLVDLGNLDHYENIHFKKNRALSGYIPIMPTVGNHETYGTLGMQAYYDHFYLDSLAYQGISSGSENYYAFQAGNTLFISMSSEHPSAPQISWLQQLMPAAQADPTVDYIITCTHRPYEAEQYVGDICPWFKNTAAPYCMGFSKWLMHLGGHHHIYSRGQFKDAKAYNVISGGTAWNQYWGMSTEQDFDYIQKTISNWMYQIIDIDVINKKVDVQSYSIGSIYQWKDNQLMDEFHRYDNQAAPNKPTLTNAFPDSIQLPYTLVSSNYSTTTNELLNTTEFQIAQTSNFTVIELDILRDYENLFGAVAGADPDTTQDINLGINIMEYEIPMNLLPNGFHYVRVRHRDRNLEWSDWSDTLQFKVYGSVNANPAIMLDTNAYNFGQPIQVTYVNGPGNATDWVGIYKQNDVPGNIASTQWQYCTGTAGQMTFNNLPVAGMYFAAFFELDGYTEIAPRVPFYHGNMPILSTDSAVYTLGSDVVVSIANAPLGTIDSVEVMKVGYIKGVNAPTAQVGFSMATGNIVFPNLPKGYYTLKYYYNGGDLQIGNTVNFQVGDVIATLTADAAIYQLGQDINVQWTDAPGIVKDWIGIYGANDDPNIVPLYKWTYYGGDAFGDYTLSVGDSTVPDSTGNYFVAIFTNDSYTEVSNRVYFEVADSNATNVQDHSPTPYLKLYPNPAQHYTFIESNYPIQKIELFNQQGQIIFETANVYDQKYLLMTEQLPAGTYFVRVFSDKVATYKLMVGGN